MKQWISFFCDAQFSKPFPCALKAFSPVFVVLCCWKPTLGTCSTPLLSCQMIFAILFSTSGFKPLKRSQAWEKKQWIANARVSESYLAFSDLEMLIRSRASGDSSELLWLQPAAEQGSGREMPREWPPGGAGCCLAHLLVVASLSLAFSLPSPVFSEKKLLFFFWCLVYNHYILK